jgi:hypothetical protein
MGLSGFGGMGGRGGRGRHDDVDPVPIVRSSRKPPKVWGTVAVEDDSLVVRLEGWRAVWAAKRTLIVPLTAVISVQHDPGVYVHVRTRMRSVRRGATTTFKLGAQHSADGWSFWACGLARNAVVVETTGVRYRYVVVEVADPASSVASLRDAAGIEEPKPPKPPIVRSITESKRLQRGQKPPPRPTRASKDTSGPARIRSIERPRPASTASKEPDQT